MTDTLLTAAWGIPPDGIQYAASGILYAAACVLYVLGILGCVLPYPGHPVIIAGCALWAWAGGEPYPSLWLWIVLSLLAVVGTFADNICALLGARRYGCSRAALWCSIIGIIAGVIFFFPIGLLAGPFLGAFLGELLITRRSVGASARSGLGALLGTLIGMLVKFIIAAAMLIIFALATYH